jgi:hypothetical protein
LFAKLLELDAEFAEALALALTSAKYVEAVLALLDALFAKLELLDAWLAELLAWFADVFAELEELDAELAAALADVLAAAASTIKSHLAESALELIGVVPVDVCVVLQRYTLLLDESFTISLALKVTPALHEPLLVPSSCVTDNSPLVSNARILLARADAPTENSVDVIVFVLDNLIDLVNSS